MSQENEALLRGKKSFVLLAVSRALKLTLMYRNTISYMRSLWKQTKSVLDPFIYLGISVLPLGSHGGTPSLSVRGGPMPLFLCWPLNIMPNVLETPNIE